jgi:hypothetical protein
MSESAKKIHNLQGLRARPERDLTIGSVVESMQQQAERQHRKMGDLIEIWSELLPEELIKQTTLVGIRGGVLAVEVETSAIAYELDRRLREGLLAELRRAYRGTLTRVKVRLGKTPKAKSPDQETRSCDTL